MKKAIVIGWLGVLLSGVVMLFWYNEWIYSLPTPVPSDYKEVKQGEYITFKNRIAAQDDKPKFIHFFNPDCPCSRFNMPHVKSLVKEYGSKVDFTIVVMSNRKHTAAEIQDTYDLNVPVVFDTTIASVCGVYSTPQAVLLTADHKLYYRGNYNKSRYCTDKNSNYAQIAVDSLLAEQSTPSFNQLALKAYGCELPNCTR